MNISETTLKKLIKELESCFSERLEKVILYGSYARNEENSESDIDIFVLVSDHDRKVTRKKINELIFELLISEGKLFSIIVNDMIFFDEWQDSMDLFTEIKKDGKILYARAG
jgi:predicted nucleotidyltransferase